MKSPSQPRNVNNPESYYFGAGRLHHGSGTMGPRPIASLRAVAEPRLRSHTPRLRDSSPGANGAGGELGEGRERPYSIVTVHRFLAA